MLKVVTAPTAPPMATVPLPMSLAASVWVWAVVVVVVGGGSEVVVASGVVVVSSVVVFGVVVDC